MLGLFWQQIAFLGHDYGHNSISKTKSGVNSFLFAAVSTHAETSPLFCLLLGLVRVGADLPAVWRGGRVVEAQPQCAPRRHQQH